MKALIFGYGSIGQQHFKVLKKIKHIKQIKIVTTRKLIKNKININDTIKYDPDYIIIANKTKDHYKIFKFINDNFKNKKVLIEKPLFHKFFKKKFILKNKYYIGFCLRYHPVINYLKKKLNYFHFDSYECTCYSNFKYWRKNISYQFSNTACPVGGGALLELSHELDYTKYLLGNFDIINSICKKLSSLKVNIEDYFFILGKNKKIKLIELKANILSNENKRQILIDNNNKKILADILKSKIYIFKGKSKKIIKFKKKNLLLEQSKDILKKNPNYINACNFKDGIKINYIIDKVKKSK